MNGTYHGDAVISVGRLPHLVGPDVYADVKFVQSDANQERREISDGTAVTIASWFQSPGPDGIHFAALASTGTVSAESLADNLSDVFRGDDYWNADQETRAALNCFGTWLLSKVRESE